MYEPETAGRLVGDRDRCTFLQMTPSEGSAIKIRDSICEHHLIAIHALSSDRADSAMKAFISTKKRNYINGSGMI